MKNPVKNNSFLLKGYFVFVLATVFLGMLSATTLIFFTNKSNHENNSQILKKKPLIFIKQFLNLLIILTKLTAI